MNTCPALAQRGAVLQDLLPRVMEEVVQRAVDPLFPPPPAAPAEAAATSPQAAATVIGAMSNGASPQTADGNADSANERVNGATDAASRDSGTATAQGDEEVIKSGDARGASAARPKLSGFEPLPLLPLRRSIVERTSSWTTMRSSSMDARTPNGAPSARLAACLLRL